MTSDWLRQTDTTTPDIVGLDYKTVGFFLSKEIGKAWRMGLTRAKRASLTRPPVGLVRREKKSLALCFQPPSRPFI